MIRALKETLGPRLQAFTPGYSQEGPLRLRWALASQNKTVQIMGDSPRFNYLPLIWKMYELGHYFRAFSC
jgi:hypothetical protein